MHHDYELNLKNRALDGNEGYTLYKDNYRSGLTDECTDDGFFFI